MLQYIELSRQLEELQAEIQSSGNPQPTESSAPKPDGTEKNWFGGTQQDLLQGRRGNITRPRSDLDKQPSSSDTEAGRTQSRNPSDEGVKERGLKHRGGGVVAPWGLATTEEQLPRPTEAFTFTSRSADSLPSSSGIGLADFEKNGVDPQWAFQVAESGSWDSDDVHEVDESEDEDIMPTWIRGFRRVKGEEEGADGPGRSPKREKQEGAFLKGLKPRKGLRGRLFK